MIENPSDDFIVPGAPSMRTTWPRGIPPSKISSRPSTKVLTRGNSVSACFEGAATDLDGSGAVASRVNAFSISSRMSRSAVVSAGRACSLGVVARAEAADGAVGAGLGPNFDSSSCRFVRPIESQIRFREEDPQPPVFVVAGDALQERLDCRLEPRLPEESNGGPEIRRRLLLRLRRGRLAARHGDVRLESVALRLRLGTDSIHRGSNHIRVVLDLRLGRSGGCGGVAIRRRRLCGWSGFLRELS